MNRWVEAHPWWGAIGVVGTLIAVATIVVVAIGSDGTVGENAFAACQIAPEFVEDTLVAPQEADFGDCTARRTGAGTWDVSGRVDAPNAFGARPSRRSTPSGTPAWSRPSGATNGTRAATSTPVELTFR